MNRTCLYDLHIRLGAKMVEFGGWEMPLMYTGIIEEHQATRSDCTMFDISHMGRVYVSGGEATNFLENLCTRRIGDMQAGQARYSHMCRPAGGILEDLPVSRRTGKSWTTSSSRDSTRSVISSSATPPTVRKSATGCGSTPRGRMSRS